MTQLSPTILPEQNAHILLESAFELCQGNPDKTFVAIQKSVSILNPELAAQTTFLLGKTFYQQNHLSHALSALGEALKYCKAYQDEPLLLEIYLYLGQTST